MGCDIHGFIEVCQDGIWQAREDIGDIVSRNYDMFGLLFGVRNYCGFAPIAANRYLPADVSSLVRSACEGDYHSATYITAEELTAIDWTKRSAQLSERVTCYRLVDGKEEYISKFSHSSQLERHEYALLEAGESIRKGDFLYRCDYTLYSDAQSSQWQQAFDLIANYRNHYDGARMVVWFDN